MNIQKRLASPLAITYIVIWLSGIALALLDSFIFITGLILAFLIVNWFIKKVWLIQDELDDNNINTQK